jgi:Flp pilus assembly protein TadB
MNWERAWMFAAALLLIAAAICLWRNNLSAAFVTGALGACAWFLSYRAQIRAETIDENEPSDSRESDSEGSGSDQVRDNDH